MIAMAFEGFELVRERCRSSFDGCAHVVLLPGTDDEGAEGVKTGYRWRPCR